MDKYEEGAAGEAAEAVDQALGELLRTVGAHVGAVYLEVPEEQQLRMTVVAGVPCRLARPWSRVALAAPVPVAEAVRGRAPVWLADPQELARRFPRTALSFPYAIAMYVVPLPTGGGRRGAMLLLWPSRPGAKLPSERARAVTEAAARIGGVLRRAEQSGHPVVPRADPLTLNPPPTRYGQPGADLTERLAEGLGALDLEGRFTFLNGKAAQLLGRERDALLGTRPWEELPWLSDPAYENAYLAALFSRLPAGITVPRPDGTWLSMRLYPDATGITVRITPADEPALQAAAAGAGADGAHAASAEQPAAPVRAGSLFHLLHLASALTEAVGVKDVTQSLTDQVMPALDVQGLALLVVDEGRLRSVGSRGFPRHMPAYFEGMPLTADTAAVHTVETGVAAFYADNAELMRAFPHITHYHDMTAFAFLPLTVSGRTVGCCVLAYDRPHPFSAEERAELTSLAGMVAQALERARLYDVNAGVARGLQDALLPGTLPRLPGLRVAARYRPATHALDVGGDFYDLIRLDDTSAAAVIGDVQGHNVNAAALMGQVRTAVHSHAHSGDPPHEILARTNRLLTDQRSSLFTSCLYAHLDLERQRARLAVAGHPPPILRHADLRTEVLDLPPGLLLGVEADADYQTTEIDLPPGTLLALYTDGLVERPGTDLGTAIEALAARLTRPSVSPLDALADALLQHAEPLPAARQASVDDMALLLLERAAEEA